jgi:phage portal protein BeeE
VIVFTGFPDGTLIAGVDTIATALALEMTSQHYANSPHPADVLENVTNIDLSEEEIREQINTWMEARRNGDVAYLSGMKLGDAKGWSPTELALEPQRNQSALQVARLLNLDPMWVGASVSGSSLTYQNRVDARTDLYGLTLTDYIYPIEQRIGMPDCAGVPVWLDASEFLRANLDTRATMATGLFTAGIITLPESRDYVSDRPTGGPTP